MAQSTTPSQDRPTQRSTPRQSNFELLRLVAMLLILIQHCLLHTEGFTDSIYAGDSPVAYYLSTLLIGCTMIAVNAFVMLSGYFGIHTSLKRILHFLSRVAVLSIGIYIYIYQWIRKFGYRAHTLQCADLRIREQILVRQRLPYTDALCPSA